MEITFIWDLDGTLLDSYGIIVDSLHQIYYEKGIDLDKKEILVEVINESVSSSVQSSQALLSELPSEFLSQSE